jgi:hypothetical protein
MKNSRPSLLAKPASILTILLFALLVTCIFAQSSAAQTNVYVFAPNQSTIVQTGGIAGLNRTYTIEGQFQLMVDFEAGTAAFEKVDANAVDDSPYKRSLDPNEVFAMTTLAGTVLSDTTLEFTGYAADGSSVLLEMTIADETVTIKAQTTPPPNSADFFIFSMDAVAQKKYAGGTGEQNNPYLIYTAEQMNSIGTEPNDWDKHFKLMADIDLSAYTGIEFNIIGTTYENSFTGVFDGNDHTISNFTYKSDAANFAGLFGRFVKGTIKDLALVNTNIDAGTGNDVGSLVGMNIDGIIQGCSVQDSMITGENNVGGLVGHNGGTIINCFSSCNVDGNSVGGLVGSNEAGRISLCYSTGSVSGNSIVGGLAGRNGIYVIAVREGWYIYGWIDNCYSTCSVKGNVTIGGLVGFNEVGNITQCYSNGSVLGNENVGGLVGKSSAQVNYCFWDVETSGQIISDGGTGKTTVEMKDPNTFMEAGWDFFDQADGPHDIWAEPQSGGYPILSWQFPGGFGLPGFSGGNGKTDDPYLISTTEELNSIGHNPRLMNSYFKLIKNVDLKNIDFYVIGNEMFPFKGIFDGAGHIILNLNITGGEYLGLFGILTSEAEIKNTGVVDVNIISSEDYIGGLVGKNDGTITGCYSTGTVRGHWWVGGLVGFNGVGFITQCYSHCTASGDQFVGGLLGRNGYLTFTDDLPLVNVIHCYSTGAVRGNLSVGGLIGYNWCTIENSFWDIQTSGQSGVRSGGIGKTTALMQTESTFIDAGWDFMGETENGTKDIWWILEGQDYPHLWWELTEEDVNTPNEN